MYATTDSFAEALTEKTPAGLPPKMPMAPKSPSAEELNHDYLWRTNKCLPERGRIGIFNRSYYEELLVVRVHPEFLSGEHLPAVSKEESIWKRRFEEINNFERYLTDNGIMILKFFLNVSKEEQKKRFLTRIAGTGRIIWRLTKIPSTIPAQNMRLGL